jgi:Tfp pilus assembly protein PilO
VVGTVLWYVFIYIPLSGEIKTSKILLAGLNQKLRSVRQAESQLKNVEDRLMNAKMDLDVVKAHFVHRKNLADIIKKIRRVSENFNLYVTDFSPVIDSFLENKEDGIIKILPVAVTIKGRYLQIGKFLENFDNLDFYLTPQKITIEKLNLASNELTATITCNLYTWND